MSMYAEVMPPAQQQILRKLGPIATEAGFYLGGGTAVAIRLGHRRSVDLDWFTSGGFSDPLELAATLRSPHLSLKVDSVDRGTLHAQSSGVRLSFLEYRYALLSPPTNWADFGCDLASLEDLVSMKLSAIAGRGSRKDFVDLYALLSTGLTLVEMLDLYQQKFSTGDIGHMVMSLTYFDDAEEEEMPTMLWEVEWGEVRHSIEAAVSAFTYRSNRD
jgi:nucleotidyltransferase AbiEii toxin of type IV toxin-antitoxin system